MNKNEVLLNEVSTFLCGETQQHCSDSSICFDNSKCVVSNLNASNNNGLGGGSMITMNSCLSGTNVEYSQGVNGLDNYEVVSGGYAHNFEKCNFVNCTFSTNLLFTSNNIITLISCVIWNIKNKQLVISGNAISIVDCVTNCETNPSITKASYFVPNRIFIGAKKCSLCTYLHNNYYIHRTNMFMLSILLILYCS